jgi:putative ABC transport system substrate-binding protein
MIKRRAFIAGLGSAAAWPVVARGQERVRRIGVLVSYAETDPVARDILAVFRQELAALGWSEGRNLRFDLRWSAGDIDRVASFAKELVALQPDVILSNATPVTAAIQHETRTIPIVFVAVADPVGSGFVNSLPRPGGNITGFINMEATLAEKWLEFLKEIAPRTTRVSVIFNPLTAPYAEYYLKPLQAAAPKRGVTPFLMPVRSEEDVETVITKIAHDQGSSLVAMADTFLLVHRKLIIELTAQLKIPAIYAFQTVPREGGLISYSADTEDLFARATVYVDRILRGGKPAELPVQVPTKFKLAINLRTAKALGLDIPPSLLIRADEVIE